MSYRHITLNAFDLDEATIASLKAEFCPKTPWCVIVEGWESFVDVQRPWTSSEPEWLAMFLNNIEDLGHPANVVSRYTFEHDDVEGEFFRALHACGIPRVDFSSTK